MTCGESSPFLKTIFSIAEIIWLVCIHSKGGWQKEPVSIGPEIRVLFVSDSKDGPIGLDSKVPIGQQSTYICMCAHCFCRHCVKQFSDCFLWLLQCLS